MIFLAKTNHPGDKLVLLAIILLLADKPSSFPQRSNVDGRVYSPTKLIVDALNHSFVTSAQAYYTPIGPSKTTDANIKNYPLLRHVNSIFLSPTTPEEILTAGLTPMQLMQLHWAPCLWGPHTSVFGKIGHFFQILHELRFSRNGL